MWSQLGRNMGQRLLTFLSSLTVLPAGGAHGPELPAAAVPMAQVGDGGKNRGDNHFLPTLQGRFGRPGSRASGGLCESHTRDPSCSLLGPYAQGRIPNTLEKPRREGSVPA